MYDLLEVANSNHKRQQRERDIERERATERARIERLRHERNHYKYWCYFLGTILMITLLMDNIDFFASLWLF